MSNSARIEGGVPLRKNSDTPLLPKSNREPLEERGIRTMSAMGIFQPSSVRVHFWSVAEFITSANQSSFVYT
jgi:hypothetical protein